MSDLPRGSDSRPGIQPALQNNVLERLFCANLPISHPLLTEVSETRALGARERSGGRIHLRREDESRRSALLSSSSPWATPKEHPLA
ncbi:hypothetical protein CEXT_416781 [Caerostris extrusa]|uniref:Uncharacterized protein n=1 Tax=Caerostris extrusa TaxID=172846 RepID=A0AAV4V6E4_CAEEX|nr:hypothetical protein CEXT_416781 [Caerostris extrusa]